MAELTGISADTIDRTTLWHLREETLRPANTDVVNAHYRHPMAQLLGDGTLSSSDGLRLPTRGKSLTGRALSRYFVHEGLTSYTHVSDQHSTFGTQIIVSTERDATFTLDEILGNTTELPLLEHTTDSHGQMLATFAMSTSSAACSSNQTWVGALLVPQWSATRSTIVKPAGVPSDGCRPCSRTSAGLTSHLA